MKNGLLTKTLAVAAAVLAIIGGVWAADLHWVPRETHQLDLAAMSKAVQGIVDSNQIQRTQDEVFFWMRMEMSARERLARNPNDQAARRQMNEAIEKRCQAEKRLRELHK